MSTRAIAEAILSSLGGRANIRACGICATRLRIFVHDMAQADVDGLTSIRGVLGIVERGVNGLEVVLGPRLVSSVSSSLSEITGISSSIDELVALGREPAQSSISIQVSESKLSPADDEDGSGVVAPLSVEESAPVPLYDDPHDEDDEDDAFNEVLMSFQDGGAGDDDGTLSRSLLVINGPNINLLGIREPSIYGNESYAGLVELCRTAAEEAGFDSCECAQSNHEGDLVEFIQQALGVHDAIVINPAAYTHTSVALLDALKAVQIPAVEVHISDVDAREPIRRISYVRDACIATISGHGIEGYREAIALLAEHLGI